MKFFQYRSWNISGVYVLLILACAGCTGLPRFTTNQPVELSPGVSATHVITVKNVTDKDSIYLIPGGPYVSSEIQLDNVPTAISLVDEEQGIVAVATATPELQVVNMMESPGKIIAQLDLTDRVQHLLVNNNVLYAGFENSGIQAFDLSNPAGPKRLGHVEIGNISRIHFFNEHYYALAENKTLLKLIPGKTLSTETYLQTELLMSFNTEVSDFVIYKNQVIVSGAEFGLAMYNFDKPSAPSWTFRLQDQAQRLTLGENYLYVAGASGGMTVFELRDDDNPLWTGSHNKFESIDYVNVRQDTAIVVEGNKRLATLNIKNRSLPITGSFYKPEREIRAISTGGHSVYLALTGAIQRVELPDRPHSQISNEGINQGGTRRAFIKNDIAYVADWFSGLHIYDISNPQRSVHLSNFHTPGSSKGVVVENGIAYVGDDDHGLQIIDVSDPANPRKISDILTTGLAYTLKKQGHTIYLADHRGGLHIIDVSEVKKPKILGSYDTPGKSWAIEVKNQLAYVADDNSGLLVLDVSNPAAIRQIGQFNPGGFAEDVFIRDNIAFISFFDLGLYIVDISKPRNPVAISHLPIPGNARSITVVDNLAYIAGWESGLQIVDVTDLESPFVAGQYDTKGSAWGVDVYKNHAYIWDWWGGVKVVDITNPARPLLADQYHARGRILKLRSKGNYIYTANGAGGVQVFDINNSLNPIWVTGQDFSSNVTDVWTSDKNDTAYIALAHKGISTLDVASPFYVSVKDNHAGENDIFQLREQGHIIAAADKYRGLLIFTTDTLNTSVPVTQLKINVQDLWFTANNVLLAGTDSGFYLLNIDDNGKMTEKQFYDLQRPVNKLYGLGDFVVTATDRINIQLWRREYNRLTLSATIPTADKVLGLVIHDNAIYVNSAREGLLVYSIGQHAYPIIQARYPSTDHYSEFIVRNNSVFFAGASTIGSIELIPGISVRQLDNQRIEVSFPGNLAIGSYHLELRTGRGQRQLWPNAVTVRRPQSGKPKLTIDQFKKLLQQHRSNNKP